MNNPILQTFLDQREEMYRKLPEFHKRCDLCGLDEFKLELTQGEMFFCVSKEDWLEFRAHLSWAVCSECNHYHYVKYWYGGYFPLCRHCVKETLN